MARGDTYTQQYSNFIGADMSSDPREVSRNRLAYSVNMWRDYESEQGAAVETFPGFRKVANSLGKVHGIYGYRDSLGKDYVIVHGGNDLYCYDHTNGSTNNILEGKLADSDSTGFLFNNKLYIQDGTNYIAVSGVVSGDAVSVTAEEVEAYIPTTYYDGKPYEQRNMLVDEAYEIFTYESAVDAGALGYEYYDEESTDKQQLPTSVIKGNKSNANYLVIDKKGYNVKIASQAFNGSEYEEIDIICTGSLVLGSQAFKDCKKLKKVNVCIYYNPNAQTSTHEVFVTLSNDTFEGCDSFEIVRIYSNAQMFNDNSFVMNDISFSFNGLSGFEKHNVEYDTQFDISDVAIRVLSVEDKDSGEQISNIKFKVVYSDDVPEGMTDQRAAHILINAREYNSGIKVKMKLSPLHFSAIENVSNFYEGNTDYRKTGVEAIKGCTKSAVYDGRIFLTGNPELPNTIFFTQRNITGANDPTYFGAYNYMNDGDGNSPNVDLLSTPSMLMVLKNNTVQDGSVYYHVATDNASEDQTARNLLPRIYPSTSGVAGLGCAGKTVPGSVACNFLDDPVFLSTRGLEAVGKQTVNLERTITHRSGNVDRLLIKEDLSSASLAEWKGYLVICCNGHVYLADSRVVTQHEDGSYQYEWYYLEGIGCWESKLPRYRYLTYWANDEDGVSIGDYTKDGKTARETLKIHDERYVRHNGDLEAGASITADGGWLCGDNSKTLYYDDEGYLVEQVDDELYGAGTFYGAKKVFASGDLLFFGTDGGELLLVNTDKRGVPDYEGQILERDKISRQWYTFDGVAYESLCSLRLDDCGKKALAKNTVSGTTVARFKMMPGASCQVMVSLNGRDWNPLGRAVASRYDADDFDFETFAFAENEDEVAVLPELTRNWVMKQYLFKSGGFKRPFGLYELSYLYYAKGKIRR